MNDFADAPKRLSDGSHPSQMSGLLRKAGQIPCRVLPCSAQSNGQAASDQPPALSTAGSGNCPASLAPAECTHIRHQQQPWSKAYCGLASLPQQQSSWGGEQEPHPQACLGAGLQPPATPEPHHRPRSCILPQVNAAPSNQAQTSQEGSLTQTTQDVEGPFRQHDRSRGDAGKPPAIAPITEPCRTVSELGKWDGLGSQDSQTTGQTSAPWTQPTFARGAGTPAGGHLHFSRYSRGQPWARCNSAPGPVPLAPLSFCWQQGHLPDIYQNMSTSPSRLKAQAHRGGQGAKSCLAW